MSDNTVSKVEFIEAITGAVNGHPILQFLVLHPDHIGELYPQILTTDAKGLYDLYDHYAISTVKGREDFHVCPVYDVIFDDLKDDEILLKTYNALCNAYNKQVIELFINNDKSRVKNKLRKAITFTMEKVYKTDTIIIQYFKPKSTEILSVNNLITDIIENEYKVLSRVSTDGYNITDNSDTYRSQDLMWVTIRREN